MLSCINDANLAVILRVYYHNSAFFGTSTVSFLENAKFLSLYELIDYGYWLVGVACIIYKYAYNYTYVCICDIIICNIPNVIFFSLQDPEDVSFVLHKFIPML